ncbi:MAG TPA: hypothetical protein VFQ65_12550 [Kofleriaceae bacterium]|nr:hypothetical protein [Kofleriaceae bacterium]
MLLGACANNPEYVDCGSSDAMDACHLDSANAVMMGAGMDAFMAVKGSIHVPVKPETADLTKARMALQATMPAGVDVPLYKIDQYDVSLEYTIKNLDSMPGQIKIGLNGANEDFAWDPTLIMPAGNESPPAPDLAGDVPIDIQANGEYDGLFREDQLLESAIDLDQITRGNINMYAATLTVNKNDASFQPLSAQQAPPMGSDMPPMQSAMGSAVPRAAFRNFVRVDILFKTDAHMTIDFNLRVRPHVNDVIHDMGLNAPVAELTILDPAPYVPAYTP